jgi:hypothetical protein
MSSENYSKTIHESPKESDRNPASVPVESFEASSNVPPNPSIEIVTKDATSCAKTPQDEQDPVIVQFGQNVTEFCESMENMIKEQQKLQQEFKKARGSPKYDAYHAIDYGKMRLVIEKFEEDEINTEGLIRKFPQREIEKEQRDEIWEVVLSHRQRFFATKRKAESMIDDNEPKLKKWYASYCREISDRQWFGKFQSDMKRNYY